jgi:hypothetical protein
MRIGIDFDNTLASYDEPMHQWAIERGLISPTLPKNKRLIRDAIRQLGGGEAKWRALQVFCYGPGMSHARAMPGVKEFLAACKARGVPVWIVSHKTEHANFGDPTVRLRDAALRWLEAEGFLNSPAFGIANERVFFEETREAKIERIRMLGLTHFIDDLEETFLEPSFPQDVVKILFSASQPSGNGTAPWHSLASWPEVGKEVLGL